MDKELIDTLRQIKVDLISGQISTASELANRLYEAAEVTGVAARIPHVVPSEPPSAKKYNKTVAAIEKNLKNSEYMFDILLAAAMYDFDTATEALNSLEDRIAGLGDSTKTLYFFSEPARGNVHVVGTDFSQGWGQFKNGESELNRDRGAGLTLPIITKKAATGRGTLSGDGIPGNFFMVDSSNNLLANENSYRDLKHMADCNPSTHFEYERFKISADNYAKAGGYGFGFYDSELKWADPSFNSLSMELTFNYGTPVSCNYITISPGVPSDEYTVKSIVLYSGGVETRIVEPKNLIINQELMMHGQEGYANQASYIFEPCIADKVVFKLQSTTGVPCRVAHYYEIDDDGARVAGESPTMSNPHFYINQVSADDEYQRLEFINAERYSIGIKDIFVQDITYGTEGYAITDKPIRFSKPIDRVALESEYDIPENTSLTFSISFDDGMTWYDINPLGSSIKDQIVAVNDMVPDAYKDPSTKYVSEAGSPTSLICRVSFKRERGKNNVTPVVKTVKLEVTLKQ